MVSAGRLMCPAFLTVHLKCFFCYSRASVCPVLPKLPKLVEGDTMFVPSPNFKDASLLTLIKKLLYCALFVEGFSR